MAICSWCGTDAEESAKRHEGPHSTWCVHFRESQRGGIAIDYGRGPDRTVEAAFRKNADGSITVTAMHSYTQTINGELETKKPRHSRGNDAAKSREASTKKTGSLLPTADQGVDPAVSDGG